MPVSIWSHRVMARQSGQQLHFGIRKSLPSVRLQIFGFTGLYRIVCGRPCPGCRGQIYERIFHLKWPISLKLSTKSIRGIYKKNKVKNATSNLRQVRSTFKVKVKVWFSIYISVYHICSSCMNWNTIQRH